MRALATPLLLLLLLTLALAAPAPGAQNGRVTAVSKAPFTRVIEALEQAIADEKMGLVCHANAQRAAAGRGVSIKGNQVLMVFRNDFAPYRHAEVRAVAAELDPIFEQIVARALAAR